MKKTDKGHPDVCNVCSYYEIFAPSKKKDVREWCTKARKGCTECKAELASAIIEHLAPIRKKREALARDRSEIVRILEKGRERAHSIASKTIAEAKGAAGMI